MASLFLEPLYAAAVVSDPPGAIFAALELLSHIPMLYAVVYALNAGHLRLGMTALASLVVSLTYHTCRAGIACLAVDVNTWRMLDHICVLWVLGELAMHLYMTSLVRTRSRAFFVAMGYLNFPVGLIAVLVFPYALLSGIIVALFLGVVGVVRVILLTCAGDHCPCCAPTGTDEEDDSARVRVRLLEESLVGPTGDQLTLIYLLVALCSTALGFVFYCLGDGSIAGDSVIDAVSHILWHCFSGIALYCASAGVSYSDEAVIRRRAARKLTA